MSNNEDLKPCPFCGGKAEVVYIKDNQYVRCSRCGAVGANTFNTEDVIADWNRRVCVKQNSETLDTNSVASSGVNTSSVCKENLQAGPRLTYTDIERMVKPLEWKLDCNFGGDSLAEFGNAFFRISFWGEAKYIVFYNAGIIKGGFACLDDAKQGVQEFLVDLVAAALGVERSGE